MGNSDISRNAFDPAKHYSSVRMQQGRVMVDDDWNENERIRMDQQIKINHEVIGDHGTPDDGFRIQEKKAGGKDFNIKGGTYYIEGLRIHMEEDESFLTQKDWLQLQNDPENLLDIRSVDVQQRTDFVYLEAWQQPVTAVEDEELFEPALGGPDTSTRIRTMHRIRVKKDITGVIDCSKQITDIKENWRLAHDQKLTVSYTQEEKINDLCSPSVQSGYLGAENQAIRVQMTGDKKFIWGYNNASQIYKVKFLPEISTNRTIIEFITQPKDAYHWPKARQVVELLPRSAVLSNNQKIANICGLLGIVEGTDIPGSREKIAVNIQNFDINFFTEWDIANGTNPEYCFLRVWDQGPGYSSAGEITLDQYNPTVLGNTGIQIKISGTEHYPGDYWIIAARPETPKKVVPWVLQNVGLQPHGIKRYYAPLAFIEWSKEGENISGKVIHDCRKTFRPLTQIGGCCTLMVGDGKQSKGDFNDIQLALENLPADGGKICLLPGEHFANVEINQKRNIWIMGCGEKTIVRSSLPDTVQGNSFLSPIFNITNSDNIRLTDMTLSAESGTAINLEDSVNPADSNLKPSLNIFIRHNNILAREYGIKIKVDNDKAGNNNICIQDNHIGMIDSDFGQAAICCLADHVAIERNKIVVVPKRDPDDPYDPRPLDDPSGSLNNPCFTSENFYEESFQVRPMLNAFFVYVFSIGKFTQKKHYTAKGGIQIEGGSENVRITGNDIIGGTGNGITLGSYIELTSLDKPIAPLDINFSSDINMVSESTPNPNEPQEIFSTISEILIGDNLIINMGWNGIASASFNNVITLQQVTENELPSWFVDAGVLLTGMVEDLIVYHNSIKSCAQQFPETLPKHLGFGGIVLGNCEKANISENCIEDNGESYLKPICGIYIMHGEKIEITHNRILNNGRWVGGSEDSRKGVRGGIYLEFTSIHLLYEVFGDKDYLTPDGIPSVKIHDNIITQPYGQALFIKALGPVSIVGNQLTTQYADIKVNPYSAIAGSVYILNLGISKDASWNLFLQESRISGSTPYSRGINESARTSSLVQIGQLLLSWLLPNGNVLFANNQVTLDLRRLDVTEAFSSQLILSLDDVSYNNNQSEITSYLGLALEKFDAVKTDVAILACTIRTNNNRFQESYTKTYCSLLAISLLRNSENISMNSAIGNQATHCMILLPDSKQNVNYIGNMVLFKPFGFPSCEEFRTSIKNGTTIS